MQSLNDDPPGAGRMNEDRKPGLYWLVELHDGPHATMYLQIPPERGYPCGFTFTVADAFAYKSKWCAKLVAWRLSRRGIGVSAHPHIWL